VLSLFPWCGPVTGMFNLSLFPQ